MPRSPAKHADGVYAYVEAAQLYTRALEAGRRLDDVADKELGGRVRGAGGFVEPGRATTQRHPRPITVARRLTAGDPLKEAELLLKRSRMEEKLGKCQQALRWAARARKALKDVSGPDAARQGAH